MWLLIAMAASSALPGLAQAQAEVLELTFGVFGVSGVDAADALESVVKVRQGVYLMTIRGGFEDAFEEENQRLIDDPLINDRSRYCSVFSAHSGGSVLMGRNWHNENVGSIIVTLYHPPDAYAPISFSRSIEMGSGKAIDLAEMRWISSRATSLSFSTRTRRPAICWSLTARARRRFSSTPMTDGWSRARTRPGRRCPRSGFTESRTRT